MRAKPLAGSGAAPAGWAGAFAGRLVVLGAIFGIAFVVDFRETAHYSARELSALYTLVLVGFLQALAMVALVGRGRGTWGVWLELLGDGLLLTGLVYCSGGVRSLFGVLYITWIVSAALRSGSRAAVLTSVAASVSYTFVALGPQGGWIRPFEAGPLPPLDEALAVFGIHVAGFLAVALLAHRLAAQLHVRQTELMELGEIHARIFENVSSGLLTVDGDHRITSFNREAERITGMVRGQILGSSLQELFPTLRSFGPGAGFGGVVQRLELQFRNRSDELLHLGFSRSPLRDASGDEDGAVLIFQDLTRVREMEEELRRSERLSAVGQLAAGLAHEIRNPLASLSGALELLSSDLPDGDPNSRRLLRIVHRETERLDRLVSDFLTYAGSRPVEGEPVPLNELFEELSQLLASGEHAGVRLACDVPAGLRVLGNPDQLRQVFWNLVLNAAQASKSGTDTTPVVHVQARTGDGERVEVEVRDEGRGIPADVLDRIFEPFFTTRAKGTGLGLAMVHRVVESHGGQIAVRSEEGAGTTVQVVLLGVPKAH